MSRRHFDPETRRILTRKPTLIEEIATVRLHGEPSGSIPTYPIVYAGIGPLDGLAAILEGREIEFAAFSPGGRAFLVNTEGYGYARYIGELGPADAATLLEAQGGWDAIREADGELVRELAEDE